MSVKPPPSTFMGQWRRVKAVTRQIEANAQHEARTRPAYRYQVSRVLSVHDGDTLRVDLDLGLNIHTQVNVRLLGWNCPELKESKGIEARETVKRLVAMAKVIIVETEKDTQSFGRWVARVYVDGDDLGAILQAKGLATPNLKDLGVLV